MIRFATPVFDSKGKKLGIVILNYFGSKMIKRLKDRATGTSTEISLVNSDGYWFLSPNPEDNWGFMYEEKKDKTFGNKYLKEWERISKEESGQFYTENGLFTFSTVYPIKDAEKLTASLIGLKRQTSGILKAKSHYWKTISRVTPKNLQQRENEITTRLVKVYLGALALFSIISCFVLRQVTLRKEAESTLIKSKLNLQAIVKSVGEGIISIDSNSKILFVNEEVCRIFDYSEKELLNKDVQALLPEHYRSSRAARLKKLVSEAPPKILGSRIELEGLHKNGKFFPIELRVEETIDESGERFSTVSIRDITERIKAEKELKHLAAAIDQAEEAIVVTDRDAIIQYVNPAFERITGYKREEAIGQNPRVLKGGKHGELFYKELWDTLVSGKRWRGNFTNKKKNGEIFIDEASIAPIFDSYGEITSYVAVHRDITKNIKLERQIRQSQKMDAIGKMAGGIAHDFNNILTAIIGYTEIAEADLPEKSDSRKSLGEVLKASNRAKDLVKQILTFSRATEHELKPIQLHLIIKESLEFLRASLPTTIEIHSNIEKGSDIILGDPTQISQIIMNLCTNAEHAMRKKGGILIVNLEPVEVDEEFAKTHKGLKTGDYMRLTVSDTGSGIDKEIIEHIFDPFFTTKPKGEGTGMGLSLIHGIVVSHGGVVTVYSEVGQGTTFNIFLPRAEVEHIEKEKKEDLIPEGSESILLVDDEEAIALMSKKALERLGYKVVSTTNAKEALDLFKESPEKFDIVLSDVTMPGMTGVDLAKELMNIRKDIPVVLSTGYSSIVNEKQAKEMGVREFIIKPFIKRTLANVIRKVLDKDK
ncbi:MAG TPA: PAS domain S-box protein [Nitrospinota bacterium]|nr:PAS domain S-box protein [Nitrospinota bacterium]|tara:strand:+ start:5414 stop:7873 length:2460 start_codon:yes stop_codon:yes gene_type:complete